MKALARERQRPGDGGSAREKIDRRTGDESIKEDD